MFCFSYVKWVSLKVTDTKTKLLIVSQSGKCSQQKWNMCVCSLVLWQHEQLDSRQSGQMLWSTYGRHFPLFLPTGKLLVNERDEVLDGEKCRLNGYRTAEGGPVSQPATFSLLLFWLFLILEISENENLKTQIVRRNRLKCPCWGEVYGENEKIERNGDNKCLKKWE